MNKAKNQNQLAQSQNELARLSENVKRSTKFLEESILKFEEKRLCDLKQVLMEYARIEMTFAAKCLENWSQVYQKLNQVNPAEDMIIFQQSLNPRQLTDQLGVNSRFNGMQQQSLTSQLQNTSMTQPTLLTPSGNPQSSFQASATPVNGFDRS